MMELKGNGGFTLIEIIWVLLIAGLLVLVSYPIIGRERANFQLEHSARIMAERIREVQAISWNDDSHSYSILFSTATSSYLIEKSGDRDYTFRYRLPDGVKLEGENFTHHKLTFYSDGANVTGGTVYLKDALSGRNLFVIVLPVTGRVRISDRPPN